MSSVAVPRHESSSGMTPKAAPSDRYGGGHTQLCLYLALATAVIVIVLIKA